MLLIETRSTKCDFRFLPRCKWHLRCSGMLRSIDWSSSLGLSWTAWPLMMRPIGCPEISVTNYQSTLCSIPDGRRPGSTNLMYPMKTHSNDVWTPVSCRRAGAIAGCDTPSIKCHCHIVLPTSLPDARRWPHTCTKMEACRQPSLIPHLWMII